MNNAELGLAFIKWSKNLFTRSIDRMSLSLLVKMGLIRSACTKSGPEFEALRQISVTRRDGSSPYLSRTWKG